VAVRRLAARVEDTEDIVSAIPVFDDDFDQQDPIADCVGQIALGLW